MKAQTQSGECHAMTEAEVGMMTSEGQKKPQEAREDPLLEPSERGWPC